MNSKGKHWLVPCSDGTKSRSGKPLTEIACGAKMAAPGMSEDLAWTIVMADVTCEECKTHFPHLFGGTKVIRIGKARKQ